MTILWTVSLAGGPVLASSSADLAIVKVDSVDPVTAGDGTFDYVLTVVNNGPDEAQDVVVTDNLPAGVIAVSTSGCQEDPVGVPTCTLGTIGDPDQAVFRATEYPIAPGSFTGLTFDLVLDQALAADYFVIVQGSDGDGGSSGDKTPDQNYVQLFQDPFATGDLGLSTGADVLAFRRQGASASWVGVVTVVECLADCDSDGFRLRSVELVDHAATVTAGTDASATAWSELDQTLLLGGFNGAGCATGETDVVRHPTCHARIFPSGTSTIEWTRDDAGAPLGAAQSTVMALEWGSSWTVQRKRVQGNNGGNGADSIDHFNTVPISPVARASTWVWGTGHTAGNGAGNSAEGVLLTLGNGQDENVTESLMGAGLEHSGQAVDFEVYALTHPDLAVDHVFKPDGNSGDLTVDVAVAAATAGSRMAFATNGAEGTGTAWPRSMFSARYLSDSVVRLERRRSNTEFPARVQGIDFSAIEMTGSKVRQITLTVAVDPATLGTITNDASVSALTADLDTSNNSASEDTTVTASADLTVSTADSEDPAVAGRALTYTVTVLNQGPSDATGVAATTSLPAGAALVATTGCVEDPAGVPTCTLGTVASGAPAQFAVEVAVDEDAVAELVSAVSVSADTADPDDSNNSATEVTTLSGEVDAGDGGNPAIDDEPVMGNFVVAWQGPPEVTAAHGVLDREVSVRLFESRGMPVGVEMRVNTTEAGVQSEPDLAGRPAGDFVVTWQSEDQDGDDFGVVARFLDAAGMPVGVEFQVNEATRFAQTLPAVAADGDGGFVIAWSDQDGATSYRHTVRRFNADGMPVGVEMRFGLGLPAATPPALAVHDTGEFLVVWEDANSDVSGLAFDATGMPVGVEFRINIGTGAGNRLPAVAPADDEGFLVSWQREGLDGKNDIFNRLVDGGGMPVGVEHRVNADGEADALRPSVVVDPATGFVVTWEQRLGAETSDIAARPLDAQGMPVGVEYRINQALPTDQIDPAVTYVPERGTFFVTWESIDSDGDGESEVLVSTSSQLFTDGFESGDLRAWSN